MLIKSPKPLEITTRIKVISSLRKDFSEEDTMKRVKCQFCNGDCVKCGKTAAGSQRWKCKVCSNVFTVKINHSAKQLNAFLNWLFSKQTQKDMPGGGRTFRRNTAMFWNIWPMPPKVEEQRNVLFLDGIYIAKKACVLICCDEKHVLGWYLCRYEHAGAWEALMSRIAEPKVVVSDGGTGFAKALKKTWKNTKHQRCIYHVFSQIKRYTTSRPRTAAGIELYGLAKDLFKINTKEESEDWMNRYLDWIVRYQEFLNQRSTDEFGNLHYTHERLVKAKGSMNKLLKDDTMFTYLDKELQSELDVPSTNNRIEGGINSCLRAMLREHRGLSVERRLKAVYWWCYVHQPNPLSASEILKVMPTDKSISDIYKKLTAREKLEESIPQWGDAIVWSEFHHYDKPYNSWD